MSLNWREIDLILSELDLPGTRIQRVSQPDFSSLVLSLYRTGAAFDLYISLSGGRTRLHRLTDNVKKPEKSQRFAQLLRSRCRGARIREAYQLGEDRIVKILAAAGDVVTILWVRLWSGAANIIATDESSTILDAFYRRPARREVSGESFDPEIDLSRRPPSPRREFSVRDLPGSGDFNARVEAYYRETLPLADLASVRAEALALLDRRETRLLASIDTLERKRTLHSEAERYKQLGDLLMSNLHTITEGDRWVHVEDYYHENDSAEIEIDPTLRPEQNAEAYYEKYKKAKSGWEKLGQEIRDVRSQLETLRGQRAKVENTDDSAVLRRILGRDRRGQQKRESTSTPGLQFHSGSYRLLIGRSGSENDELLRRHVRGNDLWLHTRDYPGGYVFIRNLPGKSVPLEVLLDAGNLALYYSKARSAGWAELYYTQVKYLRRPKEGKIGLVLPTQEKNLHVRLDAKRIDRLLREREEAELGIS